MKRPRFNVAIQEENTCYIAECIDNSVVSRGSTVEEALNNLKNELELYYEDESISVEVESFSIRTVNSIHRPRLTRRKLMTTEKGLDELKYILCIDFHLWILKIPVLGQIYALMLFSFFLIVCHTVLQLFLNGEFVIALIGTFALVWVIWIVCLARKRWW